MKDKILKTLKQYNSLEGRLFRGSLSYSALLSLFPGLILVIWLYQNSVLNPKDLLDFLYQFLPQDLISPFVNYIMNRSYDSISSMLISILISGYAASSCFYSFMIYSANHENFKMHSLFIRIKATLLFFLYVGCVCGVAYIIWLFPSMTKIWIPLGLLLTLNFFYKSLSFQKRGFMFGVLGAAFVMIAIMVVSYFFFLWIKLFTTYDSVYGPIASLIILFFSVHLISDLIFFGYCLNLSWNPQALVPCYKHQWILNWKRKK